MHGKDNPETPARQLQIEALSNPANGRDGGVVSKRREGSQAGGI